MERHTHGADDAGQWIAPVQTRDERPWSVDPADFAVPDRTDPMWKLSDLDRLAPLWGERPAATVSESAFHPEDLVSAIALQSAEPTVVAVAAGETAVVVLDHTGAASAAENVLVDVADGASLTLVSIQQFEPGAIYSAAHQATVGRGATLLHFVISLSGDVARVNPTVRLVGDGAQAELYGLSFADAGQHFESQVFVHHIGRRTRARVLYKSALQGERARTVWVGDVLIGKDATGTDTYEQNRNLVLTEGARADSIPNLEIETGDIEGAGHASATGRFDDEQLFYLMARGIPEVEARRLVVLGFLTEIVQKVPDAALQERLAAAIEAKLARTAR